jgi:RNA polymerase sigma-70 factor (ECF subfamily)
VNYLNETDETLVMLTLAGEQRAYEALVTRYHKTVVAAAFSVTRTHFMAEDAAQDAFVTAWMKLDTLQAPAKYGAWVCRIARNCARNMIDRYRAFLPLDVVNNLAVSHGEVQSPAEILELSEDRREVSDSVAALPEKVREIIRLHYYDDLSVAEIADRLQLSAGTVKWQLHEGRKKIRKELCALNEKYTDTLIQRVMKKVEELKLWQLKNDKSGFDAVYKEVIREVGELPECREKHHALADVLMRGWWWLPGKKSDALFARIAEAAMAGKNEEVMTFIVTREDSKLSGNARIEFIRDKQIPRLEKAGFVKALGREWFWLGYDLFREGKAEEGNAAYDRVEQISEKSDLYRTLIPYAKDMERQLVSRYQERQKEDRYYIRCTAQEYRMIGGDLRFWSEETIDHGYLFSADCNSGQIFRNASSCDGFFFAELSPGESFTGSDGTTLTFLSDAEMVNTPAGIFAGCQLWETKRRTGYAKAVCRSWYKDGVGIVRQDRVEDGICSTVLLQEYSLQGGSGLLPVHTGNTWKYALNCSPKTISSEIALTVSFDDGKRTVISSWTSLERFRFDEDSWAEAIQQVCRDYYKTREDGKEVLNDVTSAIERAERLAVTPLEKTHTKAAASAARRILATDPVFSPNCTATGHWNFFTRSVIFWHNGVLRMTDITTRSHFEWKNSGSFGEAEYPIYFNDILNILQDAANAIWSDEWRIGASPIVEYTKYSNEIRTQISCEDGGSITTKAGSFDHCLKLCLEIDGMGAGLSYRGGKKAYYFAEGIGIVRTENEYCGGARTAVYELTAYDGVGEGYMPVKDGLFRRYDAIGLTDGFVGSAEYHFAADEDGDIVVFADMTGIRELPPPITQYSAVQSEVIEDRLWDEGKWEESRLRHDFNNFQLLCHYFGRPTRYWGAPDRAAARAKNNLRIMDGLGSDGVPDAWRGLYASTTFRLACALFGCGKKEKGYEWLEKAFEAYPKWDGIPDGTEMEVGDPLIYGGVKIIKGKALIRLPDGTKEPVSYSHLFEGTCSLMVYGMTATRGWEWFDPVRNEDRFRACVERAKKLAEM